MFKNCEKRVENLKNSLKTREKKYPKTRRNDVKFAKKRKIKIVWKRNQDRL